MWFRNEWLLFSGVKGVIVRGLRTSSVFREELEQRAGERAGVQCVGSWVSSVAHSATAGMTGAHVLAVTVRDTAMGLSGPIPVDVSHIEATCSASF